MKENKFDAQFANKTASMKKAQLEPEKKSLDKENEIDSVDTEVSRPSKSAVKDILNIAKKKSIVDIVQKQEKPETKKVLYNVPITPTLKRKLDKKAKSLKMHLTDCVRQLFESWVADVED